MPRLTAAEKARVVRLRQGPPRRSIEQIAELTPWSKQTVANVLHDHDREHGTTLAVRNPVASRERYTTQQWEERHRNALALPEGTARERLVRALALGFLKARGPDTSVTEVANRLGGEGDRRGQLLALERGEANPHLSTLAELADAYDADLQITVRPRKRRRKR